MKKVLATIAIFCLALTFLSGCASTLSEKKGPAKEKSLYDRLGGKEAITLVVQQMLDNVLADERIKDFFAHANPDHLEKMLIDQICEASGGPCKYTGLSMKDVHQNMGVATKDFNALVEDLVKALDKYKVPEKEKSELLSVLGGMKGDIVEKP
jgi:hemoglobin